MHGGDLIASVLARYGVEFLFTLCGGHISPILTGCKQRDIRVVDTRQEATAVFAADAVARLSGRPGVAAVTAGPGLTNTITAVKNARFAQSPVVLLGGATATILKGRGALQDIDQMALMRPHVKWAAEVRRVADLAPALEEALQRAQAGVPGPVFVECPVDLLYERNTVERLYGLDRPARALPARLQQFYLGNHVRRLFAGAGHSLPEPRRLPAPPAPDPQAVRQVSARLTKARRPLLLIGSQALLDAPCAAALAAAVEGLGLPTYLSGMARGLLGRDHPLQLRHRRREALKEADLVILAGVPCDFRLDYGRQFGRNTFLIAANRSHEDMTLNRRPDLAVAGDAGRFLIELAEIGGGDCREEWFNQLRRRDEERNTEIAQQAAEFTEGLNPLRLCREIEATLDEQAILVGDGGDFVATASYTLQPRGPLSWLDPGAFGTLGVGAGFALGAKLCRPEAEVWVLFGDGALGYSLIELDTFARHNLPVIAVVGNDGGWSQIAREQVEFLHDDVGTVLAHNDYHHAAEGLGAAGLLLDKPEQIGETLRQARALAAAGYPVLVNAILGRSAFRKGSISM